MAVDTVPNGFPIIPILTTSKGAELYGFLEQLFRRTTPGSADAADGPAYLTIRMGDSVISVMRPLEGQPTRSARYIYVRDVDNVHRRAIEAGARSVPEPTRAIHGDQMATIIDLFGNLWTIAQDRTDLR